LLFYNYIRIFMPVEISARELERTCNKKEIRFTTLHNFTPVDCNCLPLFKKRHYRSIKTLTTDADFASAGIVYGFILPEEKFFAARALNASDIRNGMATLAKPNYSFFRIN